MTEAIKKRDPNEIIIQERFVHLENVIARVNKEIKHRKNRTEGTNEFDEKASNLKKANNQ